MKKLLFALLLCLGFRSPLLAADITIAYDVGATSMDPMEQLSQQNIQMATLIYEPLVRDDKNLNVVPVLAKSWEMLNPTTMRFHLRQGVTFHSGNTMSADDVIFSFNRIRSSADFKGYFTDFKSMEKIDDFTVDLTMKRPYALTLQTLTYLSIMEKDFFTGIDASTGEDKTAIIKGEESYASVHTSGTGPFSLSHWERGANAELDSFKNYWGKRGNVDHINAVVIKESATRTSALISGDVDWIYPAPFLDLKRLGADEKLDTYSIASDMIINFQLNQNKVEAFKDKRVREAFNYAINAEGIVDKLLKGNGTAASQLYPPQYAGHNDTLPIRYNLEKAKALMKEAGYEKGFTVHLITSARADFLPVAQAVAGMLSKINVKVDLEIIPGNAYYQEYAKCKADMQIIGWISGTTESGNYSEYLTMGRDEKAGKGYYNCTGYANKKLDDLVYQSNQELDKDKRAALLRKVAKIEYDDAIYVPIYWENWNFAYKKKFKNFPQIVNLKVLPLWSELQVEEN